MISNNSQGIEAAGTVVSFELGEAVPTFDPTVPVSPIDDLHLVREAMLAQRPALQRRYSPRTLDHAERTVTREMEALLGEWEDPKGDAGQALAAVREMLLESHAAQKAVIVARYGDNTLPPEALNPLKPWEAKLREVDELITDRSVRPTPGHPILSPYYLGPVRRAVMLEAATASDEVTRAAARDLAERRLVLSTPRIARRVRGARQAAQVLFESFSILNLY